MCSSSIQRLQHLIKTIVFCDRLGLASLCLLESAFCIARMVSKSQRSGGAENLRHTWKSMELTLLTRFPLCLATAPVGPWEFSVVRSLVPWQEHNVGCLACCWTCNLQPSNSNHGSQVNSRLGRGFFFWRADFFCHLQEGILQPGHMIQDSASPWTCCFSALRVWKWQHTSVSGDIRWLFSRWVRGSLKSKNVLPKSTHSPKARIGKLDAVHAFFHNMLTGAQISQGAFSTLCNCILSFSCQCSWTSTLFWPLLFFGATCGCVPLQEHIPAHPISPWSWPTTPLTAPLLSSFEAMGTSHNKLLQMAQQFAGMEKW